MVDASIFRYVLVQLVYPCWSYPPGHCVPFCLSPENCPPCYLTPLSIPFFPISGIKSLHKPVLRV